MTEQRIKAAFDTIHADEALKQRTRDYLARTVGAEEKRRPLRRAIPALAACLLVLCLSGWYLYFIPTAYISIDINPSLELGINRFDRIVSVEGYNAEAEELLDELDIRFLPYQEGLQELLESCGVDAEGIQSGTEEEDAGDDTEEDGGSRYRHHGEKEEESGHRHE